MNYYPLLIQLLLSYILLLLVVIAIYAAFIYYVPYSEGYCRGMIITFKKRGFLVKTWEGLLLRGNAKESAFPFSVEDHQQEIIKKMQRYKRQRVRIIYRQSYGIVRWKGNTKYFVTHVVPEEAPYEPYIQKD